MDMQFQTWPLSAYCFLFCKDETTLTKKRPKTSPRFDTGRLIVRHRNQSTVRWERQRSANGVGDGFQRKRTSRSVGHSPRFAGFTSFGGFSHAATDMSVTLHLPHPLRSLRFTESRRLRRLRRRTNCAYVRLSVRAGRSLFGSLLIDSPM